MAIWVESNAPICVLPSPDSALLFKAEITPGFMFCTCSAIKLPNWPLVSAAIWTLDKTVICVVVRAWVCAVVKVLILLLSKLTNWPLLKA